jgi:hypothetical protein
MTLLRRAPREVYRVYGEREFLSDAWQDERREAAVSEIGPRRLQRVAGTTMLLAATGAVGGLVAITSLSSVAGDGRRVRANLLAATRSLVSSRAARAHIWREGPGSDRHHRQGVLDRQADRARSVRSAAARPRAAAVGVGHPSAPIQTMESEPTQAAASRPTKAAAPVPIQAPPSSVARLTASSSSQPRQSGQSEFGFER